VFHALYLQNGLIALSANKDFCGHMMIYTEQGELIKEIKMLSQRWNEIFMNFEIEPQVLLCACVDGIVRVNINTGTIEFIIEVDDIIQVELLHFWRMV
jgi:hypothetical protein